MDKEKVRVVRRVRGYDVTVTRTVGDVTVSHTERLLGPTPKTVARAVRECREVNRMLLAGVGEAS